MPRQAPKPANPIKKRYSTNSVDDRSALGISQVMATSLDLIFSALSDPTRRQILTLLLEDDMAVTDVAEPFEMSLAAISKHLSVLSNAGLIQQERRGRVKWCKLDPDAMQAAWAWMQGFGHFDRARSRRAGGLYRKDAPETPNPHSIHSAHAHAPRHIHDNQAAW